MDVNPDTGVHRWLSEGAETLVREIGAAGPGALHCEVLVVGSGYGGAVAAARLAGATRNGQPQRVFVIERGQEYLPGQFPATFAELPGHVRLGGSDGAPPRARAEGLFDMRLGGDVNVLLGNGLGGGSLINAAVMERPSADAFDDPRWPAGTSLAALEPWYARAEAMLAPQTIPDSVPKLDALMATGKAMRGAFESRKAALAVNFADGHATPAGVAMKPCKRCGDCVTGCNHQAKQSLDVNYLALARANGARLFCGATVRRLRMAGQFFDVEFHFTDPQKARSDRAAPYVLRAERVILAAGTLGSTEILQRSVDLPIARRALGSNFSSNGDMIAVAYRQGRAAMPCAHEGQAPEQRGIGPTITGLVRQADEQEKQHPLVFQEFAIPAPLRRLLGEVVATTDALHGMVHTDRSRHHDAERLDDPLAVSDSALDHSMVYGMMGNDGAKGAIEFTGGDAIADGQVRVAWEGAGELDLYERQIAALKQVHEAAFGLGGRVLPNPMWQPLPWKMPKGAPLSVHPLGGCPMADDGTSGVVDAFGRVYRDGDGAGTGLPLDGLAVLDGSIVPAALGINPALTIAALAERAVPQLACCWQFDLRSADRPLSVARPQRRDLSRPQAPRETVITLHERMKGRVRVGRQVVNAEIVGRFAPTAVAALRRLPRRIDQPEMTLTFSDDQGRRLTLHCSGQVQVLVRERSSLLSRVLRVQDLARRRLRELMNNPDPDRTLLDFIALCSHLGQVRLIRYEWTVNDVEGALDEEDKPFKTGDRLVLTKRIEFVEKSNPWRQLTEGRLDQRLNGGLTALGTMVVDPGYFVEQLTPLLRVESQQDQPNALGDIVELALFVLRIVIRIHLLDALPELEPKQDKQLRLPGRLRVNGADVEFEQKDVDPPLPADPRLADPPRRVLSRYTPAKLRDGTRPVMLIHGYGDCGSTFAHPDIGRLPGQDPAESGHNLVRTLLESGREVWVLDLRTSIGLEQRVYWSFEAVALGDIPAAAAMVLQKSRVQADGRLDIMAHCIGGAMLSLALLEHETFHESVGTLVMSQVGPLLRMSPYNRARGFVMSYLRQYLGQGVLDVDSSAPFAPKTLLTDALLATFPYPDDDGEADRLSAHPGFARVRHRADAIFGQTMHLPNIGDPMLSKLDSIYGWVMVEGLAQVIHYAREQMVTGTGGANEMLAFRNIAERLPRPLLMLHGRRNAVFDWRGSHDAVQLLQQIFDGVAHATSRPGRPDPLPLDETLPRRLKVIDGYGHQDCMIGEHAHRDVFPHALRFLDEMADFAETKPKGDEPLVAELPFIGPLLGPARLEQGALHCRVALRAPLARAAAVALVCVPAKRVNDAWEFAFDEAVARPTGCHELTTDAIDLQLNESALPHYDGFAVVTLHNDLPPRGARAATAALAGSRLFVSPNQELEEAELACVRECLGTAIGDRREAIDLAVVHLDSAWIAAARVDAAPERLVIALASCQYPPGLVDRLPASQSLERLATRIASTPPGDRAQVLWLVGDQVYVDDTAGLFDPGGAAGDGQVAERAYRLNFALPAFRRVTKQLPTHAMLDDHEVEDNWEPEEPPTAGQAAALNAYNDYSQKLIQRSAAGPFDHQALTAGVPFFALDARSTRQRRALRPAKGAALLDDASLHSQGDLGELLAWLAALPADVPKVIVSSVTVFPLPRAALAGDGAERLGLDDWSGYPRSQFLLLDFIRSRGIRKVVFLSGDRHLSSVTSLWVEAPDPAQPPIEMVSVVSSGLHAPWPFANTRPDSLWLDGRFTLQSQGRSLDAEVRTAVTTSDNGFALLRLERNGQAWVISVTLDGEHRTTRVWRELDDSQDPLWQVD